MCQDINIISRSFKDNFDIPAGNIEPKVEGGSLCDQSPSISLVVVIGTPILSPTYLLYPLSLGI